MITDSNVAKIKANASGARKAKASSNVVYLSDVAKSVTKRSSSSTKKKTRYHYPKSLLVQAYFCNYGANRELWSDPGFSLKMLGNKNFVSPMGALLDQLESEGHDVKGARVEWLAFRDLAAYYADLFQNLYLRPHESTVAAHLYQSCDR